MITVTSKYVLGILAACVVGYLILLLPVLPPKMSALAGVKWWWTLLNASTVVPSPMSKQYPQSEESAAAGAAAVPGKRKRTLLEQKFAMDGPNVGWDRSTITLDYQMAEWVTHDVLDYEFYDWDCQNKLDVSVPTGWKVMVPQNMGVVQAEIEESTNNGQASEESDDEEEMKMNHWRLELRQTVGDDDDDEGEIDSNIVVGSSSSMTTAFCIRFKLYNMPKRRQSAMEVTFRQTQLTIEIKNQDKEEEGRQSIQNVQVSKPEPVSIHVKVNGRGRATVHRNSDNNNDDTTNDEFGASENPNNDETDRKNAEESRGGTGQASSPTTTSTTNKDEL